MKHSRLQLIRYFVGEIEYSANKSFNPQKEWDGGTDQLTVLAASTRKEEPVGPCDHSFVVELSISQSIQENQNFPYSLKFTLVGVFVCLDKEMAKDKEDYFVKVNGSSMLYGVARELIRSITSVGPWGPLLLPTVSFHEDETSDEKEEAASKK
jgi:preprotein translocase subunit SecB